MPLIIYLLGIVGLICFVMSGVPHLLKSVKDGHSNGLAAGTIWFWFLGEICYLIYTVYLYDDFVLYLNYIWNAVIVGGIAWYKYFPRVR